MIGIYLRALWFTLSFVLGCLAFQILPLIGPNGVLPAGLLLEQVVAVVPGTIWHRVALFPTLCWVLGTSNSALLSLSAGGSCLSFAAAIIGGYPAKIFATVATLALLSIVVVGGDFLQFP